VSRYELYLVLHVLGAAAWFGAALLSLVLVELAYRASDHRGVVWLGRYDDALAKWLFVPASLLTVAAGLLLVLDGPWAFSDHGFTLVGLAIFAATLVLGLGVIVPAGNRLRATDEAGAADTELEPLVRRYRDLSRLDVGLLTVVVVLMAWKPF
jgi:uncharacterized membrane protein